MFFGLTSAWSSLLGMHFVKGDLYFSTRTKNLKCNPLYSGSCIAFGCFKESEMI